MPTNISWHVRHDDQTRPLCASLVHETIPQWCRNPPTEKCGYSPSCRFIPLHTPHRAGKMFEVTIMLIFSGNQWQLIVSPATPHWLKYYKAQDLVRIRTLVVNQNKGMTAVLQRYSQFNLVLKWGFMLCWKKSISELEYVPILLLWLQYLPILLADFLFLSGTYFAQNCAGKICQGLPTTQLCSLQPLNYPGRDSLHNFTQKIVC